MTLPEDQSSWRAAKTTELQDLLARVEGATGADRELDVALWETLAPDAYFSREGAEFTASLDAALALVERSFPGLFFHVSRFSEDGGAEAHIYPNRHLGDDYGSDAKTPALALLAALLRALSAQTPTPKNENRNG